MKKPKPIVIDFETEPIKPRPYYPPKPVGVSVAHPGKAPRYYAWGHPTENNCDHATACEVLGDAWRSGEPLLFHNAKFDIDVAEVHMGVPRVDPLLVHDTSFLLALLHPHEFSLSLKPSAARLLGMPPEEQDAVFDWLVEHQRALKGQGLLPDSVRITPKSAGAWIGLAPGKLVGKYANGDVVRTRKLFELLYPQVVDAGMLPAYEREQKLSHILLDNERAGMRTDVEGLERVLAEGTSAMNVVEAWLRKRLKAPDINLDADKQLAEALDREGIVTEWSLTPTGQLSVNKKNLLPHHYSDQKVFQALGYRSRLATCLNTYVIPWLETARATGGILHAGWNQTRNDRDAGTRTGRLSGSPNFMAVAKSFEGKGDGWTHPDFLKSLPPLPLMRMYLLPDRWHVWGRRDYNQQELRLLGHFEDGRIMEAYRANPRLDIHTFVQQAIAELTGTDYPRTPIKNINFGYVYGQGAGSLALSLGMSVPEVQAIRNAQMTALPGLKELSDMVKGRGRAGEPITTWGGRQYYVEEPRVINGVLRTFEYKLLNTLIQGSAADVTKEAIIRYHEAGTGDARFLLTVHDEINISVPKRALKREMLRLRDIMMSVEVDVPMVSDGEFGPNWGELEPLKEPSPF